MRWRAPPKPSSMPSCGRPSRVQARADAGLLEQLDRGLLQHAGADAAEHVVGRCAARRPRCRCRPCAAARRAAGPPGPRRRWRPGSHGVAPSPTWWTPRVGASVRSARARDRASSFTAKARVIIKASQRHEFVEHRVDGLGKRPREEADAPCAAAVEHARSRGGGDRSTAAKRQFGPRRHALLDKVHLGSRDKAQRRAAAPGARRRYTPRALPASRRSTSCGPVVLGAASAGFDGADRGVREVATSDELDRLVAAGRRDRGTAAGEGAPGPVAS